MPSQGGGRRFESGRSYQKPQVSGSKPWPFSLGSPHFGPSLAKRWLRTSDVGKRFEGSCKWSSESRVIFGSSWPVTDTTRMTADPQHVRAERLLRDERHERDARWRHHRRRGPLRLLEERGRRLLRHEGRHVEDDARWHDAEGAAARHRQELRVLQRRRNQGREDPRRLPPVLRREEGGRPRRGGGGWRRQDRRVLAYAGIGQVALDGLLRTPAARAAGEPHHRGHHRPKRP